MNTCELRGRETDCVDERGVQGEQPGRIELIELVRGLGIAGQAFGDVNGEQIDAAAGDAPADIRGFVRSHIERPDADGVGDAFMTLVGAVEAGEDVKIANQTLDAAGQRLWCAVACEANHRCGATDQRFHLNVFVDVAEAHACAPERSITIFQIMPVDVGLTPRVAVGKFMRRCPARKDVEAGMIVKVDEAREDEVLRFENGRADRVRSCGVDVSDAAVLDVEPAVRDYALGSDDVAANQETAGRRIGRMRETCTKDDRNR